MNGPTDFGRFRRLQLKDEALKPSCHKENTSERESFQSLRSLPAQEAEGLEGLLTLSFLEDNIKRTGFWSLPKTEDSLLKREGTKRIRPYSYFHIGSQFGSASLWRVGTCRWCVDGDCRLSHWLSFAASVRGTVRLRQRSTNLDPIRKKVISLKHLKLRVDTSAAEHTATDN